MLETFLSYLVPQDDNLWNRVLNCVGSIPEDERLFRPQHKIKAQIHTYLAWQENPGRPMAQAITNRYLRAETAQAASFIAWIQSLFL